MYLFTTPSLPRVSLPSRERLQQLGSSTITALIWAVAITVTAGRLARIGWAWFRPRLARLLHALALLLDGGLAYPDQPEPDPTPDSGLGAFTPIPIDLAADLPDPEATAFRAALDPFVPLTGPHLAVCQALTPCTPVPAPATTKPRAARRRTTGKAAAKGAA